MDAVVQFLREKGYALENPDVLGLPATTGQTKWTIERARKQLTDGLVSGDEEVCRRVVLDVYLAKHRLSTICDQVLGGAFQSIGSRWDCGDVEVFEERRACEICVCVIHELRRMVMTPEKSAPAAMGGTVSGDPYSLANLMVELVLRGAGWDASSLGCQLPFVTLRSAIEKHRPQLFWLSVSSVPDDTAFIDEMNTLFETTEANGTALVLGGRGLTPEIRRSIRYTSFCDTLEHIEAFISKLHQPVSPQTE